MGKASGLRPRREVEDEVQKVHTGERVEDMNEHKKRKRAEHMSTEQIRRRAEKGTRMKI